MGKITKKWAGLLLVFLLLTGYFAGTASAATAKAVKTGIKLSVAAAGEYSNWDGVSNVAQFADNKGKYCFAYDSGNYVIVVKTNKGKVSGKKLKLKKEHPIFGNVICDKKGNYYVVTGEANKTENTSRKTIFVSKYDSRGKLLKTVGDKGASSLAYYYDKSFNTKEPFSAGNCAVAVNGNLLSVNYGREMYSGHQSNSVLTINTDTMKKVSVGVIYNSHSFAQRVIPVKDGFLYASEGDCYPRAFRLARVSPGKGTNNAYDVFHFWVKKGTLDAWDMWTLNNNFAHMGGLACAGKNSAALVGTSVKSLNSKAAKEKEQLFIQIFNPDKDLSRESSYYTKGRRSGKSGSNGTEQVKNYGVKWLTDYDSNVSVSHPQVTATDDGHYVVLFEKYMDGTYKGVYYIVLDQKGKVTQKSTRFSKDAKLNPCQMPVFAEGTVCWTGNKYGAGSNDVYIYRLSLD